MNPFDIFDQVYCFNLPKEKTRRKQMDEQFDKIGVKDRVIYLHSDPPPKGFNMGNMRRSALGEFGVNLSQIKGIIHAASAQAKCPIFFEDDVIFADSAKERLTQVWKEIPDSWDMLYFHGHPRGRLRVPKPIPQAKIYSKNLARIGTFSFADSYAFNNKDNLLLAFVDNWLNRISKPDAMYDIILGEFAGAHESYCVYPLLCEQRPGVSSISNKYDDKTQLVKNGWTNHLAGKRIV